MNYQTQVDVEIPGAVSDRWAGLGIRTQTGMNWNNDGYTLRVYGSGKWELYRGASIVRSGSTTKNSEGKYKLGLAAQNSQITVLIDGQVVDTYTDSTPLNAGRVKLSSSWAKTYFDNLEVKNLPGTIPYATSMGGWFGRQHLLWKGDGRSAARMWTATVMRAVQTAGTVPTQ